MGSFDFPAPAKAFHHRSSQPGETTGVNLLLHTGTGPCPNTAAMQRRGQGSAYGKCICACQRKYTPTHQPFRSGLPCRKIRMTCQPVSRHFLTTFMTAASGDGIELTDLVLCRKAFSFEAEKKLRMQNVDHISTMQYPSLWRPFAPHV
jgi:hypothetical protein